MPAAFTSATAFAITSARARCHSSDGAPVPVENHISSQQPGFSEIALKFAFHISFVSVSFALKRIDMSGRSAADSRHDMTAATPAANASLHNSLFMRFISAR